MNVLVLVQSIGSCSLFASRMFLPALLTAGLLRFGDRIPLVRSLGVLSDSSAAPVWFTSDLCLVALVVLSALELVGDKVPEVRSAVATVEKWFKPAVAALTAAGVVSATDAAFAQGAIHQAGFGQWLAPALAAAATLATTTARRSVLDWLNDADPGDALHLQRLLSWAEDAWVAAGAVLLFVLPVAMLGLILLAGGAITLLRRQLQAHQERSKVGCPACGALAHRAALLCPRCSLEMPAPQRLGALGHAVDAAVVDKPAHQVNLLAHLRCPHCAGRLARGDPAQRCPDCGQQAFGGDMAGRYLQTIDRRAPPTLLLVFVWSLFPLVGYVVAAVYGQLRLASPLVIHLPLGQRWLLRWLLGALRWLVLVLQVVPGLNGLAALAETALRYRVFRAGLQRQLAALPGALPLSG